MQFTGGRYGIISDATLADRVWGVRDFERLDRADRLPAGERSQPLSFSAAAPRHVSARLASQGQPTFCKFFLGYLAGLSAETLIYPIGAQVACFGTRVRYK